MVNFFDGANLYSVLSFFKNVTQKGCFCMQKLCFWDESAFLRCENWKVARLDLPSLVKFILSISIQQRWLASVPYSLSGGFNRENFLRYQLLFIYFFFLIKKSNKKNQGKQDASGPFALPAPR